MQRESAGRYNVLTGGGVYEGYERFPVLAGHNGSHAAGAYQFQLGTWASVAQCGLADSRPYRRPSGELETA